MVSETVDGSPTVSFKRQPKNIKCACSTVPIKYKKSKINAVRGFPEGCGPHRRIVADTLKGVVQEGVPFLVYDSEPEEVSATASMEHMEVSMPKALDTEGVFCLSNRLKYESIELSKKVVVDILPGVRISATRSFPEGCEAKATVVSNKIPWKATPSEDNGWEPQISFVKGMPCGKTSKSNAHENKAILRIMPRVYPPPRKIWANRWFPKGCGRESVQSSKEVAKQAIACAANGSISQCGNMNQFPGRSPS